MLYVEISFSFSFFGNFGAFLKRIPALSEVQILLRGSSSCPGWKLPYADRDIEGAI